MQIPSNKDCCFLVFVGVIVGVVVENANFDLANNHTTEVTFNMKNVKAQKMKLVSGLNCCHS
jgi:hypothetical protein